MVVVAVPFVTRVVALGAISAALSALLNWLNEAQVTPTPSPCRTPRATDDGRLGRRVSVIRVCKPTRACASAEYGRSR